MPLHGSVDEFGVESLLALFAASSTSGVLHLDDPALGGTVWVREGDCVWAQTSLRRTRLDPVEAVVDAVFEMVVHANGAFRFHVCDASDLSPPSAVSLPLEELARQVGERHARWAGLLDALSSLDVRVELVDTDPGEDVVIHPNQWRVLAQIASGMSVRELLASGGGLSATGGLLVSLVEAGLVAVRPVAEAARREPARQRTAGVERAKVNGTGARTAKPRSAVSKTPATRTLQAEPASVRRTKTARIHTPPSEPAHAPAQAPMSELLEEIADLAEIRQSDPPAEAGFDGLREEDPGDERRAAIEMLRALAVDGDDEDPDEDAVVRPAMGRSRRALRLLAGER